MMVTASVSRSLLPAILLETLCWEADREIYFSASVRESRKEIPNYLAMDAKP